MHGPTVKMFAVFLGRARSYLPKTSFLLLIACVTGAVYIGYALGTTREVVILICATALALWWRYGRMHERHTEEALREREEQYRIVAETASDAILTIDTRSVITYANPAAEKIFGYKVTELLGQELAVLMPDYLRHVHKRSFNRYVATHEKHISWRNVEIPGLHKDGREIPLEISFGEFRQNDKHLFTGIVRDIGERKRAQESQRLLATIVESSTDAIVGKTLDGVILSWNQAAERIYGYTAKEAIGQKISILVPSDRADEIPRFLEQVRNGERIQLYETQRLRKDGRRIDVSLTISPIKDATGSILGASAIARDITEHKTSELTLRRTNRFYQLLSEINYAVVQADSVTDLLKTVCRYAVEIGEARVAIIVQVDENASCVRPIVVHSKDDAFTMRSDFAIPLDPDTPEGRSPLGTAVRHGTFHISNEIATDITLQPWQSLAAEYGVESAAVFALQEKGRVVDALILLASERNFFEPALTNLLNRLASNISFALDRFAIEAEKASALHQLEQFNRDLEQIVQERTLELARMNEILRLKTDRLEARSRETSLMSRTTALLQSCVSSQEFYDVLHLGLPELFPGTSGRILFFDQNTRHTLASHVDWGTDAGVPIMDRSDCWALRTGSPYLYQRAKHVPSCRHANRVHDCYLCIPLAAQGQTLGVMHLSNLPAGQADSSNAEHFSLLGTEIADRIGLAWANLQLHERLENMSFRDALTGLYNRRFFDDAINREILRAGRVNQPISLMMVDLDNFKRVNDTFGHEAGDRVLQDMGALIQRMVRTEDIACRYGGEEFVIILTNTPSDIALTRAEDLRQEAMRLIHSYSGKAIGAVTLSIGVAAAPPDSYSASRLLARADEAVYKAKDIGRNRVFSAKKKHSA